MDFIVDFLQLHGGESILDLACGYGWHAHEFSRRGYSVTGADITKEFIDEAARNARSERLDARFIQADIRDITVNEEYDVVLNVADGAIGFLEADGGNLKMVAILELHYVFFSQGAVTEEYGSYVLVADKKFLLRAYRKDSIRAKLALLGEHGLFVSWQVETGEEIAQNCASYSIVSYEDDAQTIPAVENFVDAIEAICTDSGNTPGKLLICSKQQLFLKADFEAAYLKRNLTRNYINPLGEDVLATVGRYSQEWVDLVEQLVDTIGMKCSGFFYCEAHARR